MVPLTEIELLKKFSCVAGGENEGLDKRARGKADSCLLGQMRYWEHRKQLQQEWGFVLVQLCETLRRSEDDDHATLHWAVAEVTSEFLYSWNSCTLWSIQTEYMCSAVARVLLSFCWHTIVGEIDRKACPMYNVLLVLLYVLTWSEAEAKKCSYMRSKVMWCWIEMIMSWCATRPTNLPLYYPGYVDYSADSSV